MQVRRRDDADQIDIVARNGFAPVGGEMRDVKIAGGFFGILPRPAGHRDDLDLVRKHLKSRDLYQPSKTRADKTKSDLFGHK
jgi:hypothetical protein